MKKTEINALINNRFMICLPKNVLEFYEGETKRCNIHCSRFTMSYYLAHGTANQEAKSIINMHAKYQKPSVYYYVDMVPAVRDYYKRLAKNDKMSLEEMIVHCLSVWASNNYRFHEVM